MGLRQIPPLKRINFLKRFAAEIVINSGKPELIEKRIQKQIEIEKLKQKFLKPIESKNQEFKPSIFQKPVYPKKQPVVHKIHTSPIHRKLMRRAPPPKQKLISPIRRQPIQKPVQQGIRPEAQTRPTGLILGKIESLLRDKTIQSIECPGPGKNLLIKKYNKINTTRLTLNQVEITDLINNFAQQAKIPITGGILKAAVGDLVISAVISEFVGSRFILNKITPHNPLY
tara:strand:+ start:4135 stop:4818 length:684 start_codon:yes stop_codon:yes gene_type:complete